MSARILLGAFPVEALTEVRTALEARGYDVAALEDADSLIRLARSGKFDLLVIPEFLQGGTASDVTMAVRARGPLPPILAISDGPVAGADAFAPEDDPALAAEQATALLESAARLGKAVVTPPPGADARNGAAGANGSGIHAGDPPEADGDDGTLGWSVKSHPLAEVTRGGTVVPEPAGRASSTPERAPDRASDSRAPAAALPPGLDVVTLGRLAREADYFELLGVSVDADPDTIRTAHDARVALVRAAARESSAKGAHLEEVEAALHEALDVLGEPALRAAYARNRL